MRLDFDVTNDTAHYREIEAYIHDNAGADWLFSIYLDKQTGGVVTCEARWSPNKDTEFDDAGQRTPPPDVLSLLDLHRSEIVARLQKHN
jgi:hypothetical protein